MSHLYITESATKLGVSNNQVVVRNLEDNSERRIPLSEVEDISIYGGAQLSTQLIRTCISSDIAIAYYSDDGHYFGSIWSSVHADPVRQKKQVLLTDDADFCLKWAKSIINAKIRNSITLLKSMNDIYLFSDDDLKGLQHSLDSLHYAETVDMVLGFEGSAARCYFECLPKALLDEAFFFKGRSARPPKDPINSMLSYGYSLFYRNIIGAIERRGLHPYFAFMHKMKLGHAALASDLVEEFRAPLVDRTVIDIANSGVVTPDDFYETPGGATYLKKASAKKVATRFSQVISESHPYFLNSGDQKVYGFQAMLDKKISTVIEAIEKHDASYYKPCIWEE